MSNQTSAPPIKLMLASLARFDKPASPPPAAAASAPPATPVSRSPFGKPQPPVPDGEYNFIISNVELTQAKTSGNPMLKFQLKILDAPYAGRMLTKFRAITEKTVEYTRKDLAVCGLHFDSFAELPQQLVQLQGRCVSGKKATGQEGRYDIYFKRLIPKGPQSEIVPDDLPF